MRARANLGKGERNKMNLNWRSAIRADFLSSKWLLLRAALLVGLFGFCHAAGLREHTTFLSGTVTAVGMSREVSIVLGVTYLVAYFGFVLLSPILVLAACLVMFFHRVCPLQK